MSGNNRLLVDTNILLYFLNGNLEIVDILSDKEVVISFITELELLSFYEGTKESENIIKGLLENCTIIDLPYGIKKFIIEYRKKTKLKLPDAIVIATACCLRIPLLTADKAFKKVEGTEIIIYEV